MHVFGSRYRQSTLQQGARFLRVAKFGEDNAQSHAEHRVFRIYAEGVVEEDGGLFEKSVGKRHVSQETPGQRMLGIEFDSLNKAAERVLEIAQTEESHAQ